MPLSSSSVDRRIPEALSMSETDYGDAGWARFPACAKPLARLVVSLGASAGEARSEKITLQQEVKAR
jgi:hypothetical protein